MSTLLDKSILISHLRGDLRATQFLLSLPSQDRLVSVLARVEVEGGMRSQERGDVGALFSVLRPLPVTDLIARRAGQYLRRFRRSHPGIDLVDYVIGATADLHSADLATLNVKHFPMFKGLKAPW